VPIINADFKDEIRKIGMRQNRTCKQRRIFTANTNPQDPTHRTRLFRSSTEEAKAIQTKHLLKLVKFA
jgi:hypothetical protein